MPNLSATTFRSSIRQSRGFRRILATIFAALDTEIWYHMRYHEYDGVQDFTQFLSGKLGNAQTDLSTAFGSSWGDIGLQQGQVRLSSFFLSVLCEPQ